MYQVLETVSGWLSGWRVRLSHGRSWVRVPVGSYQRPSYKLPPCMARNALGLEFGSAARSSIRPGSVWNCLWGHALKRSPGINRKSRVLYPGSGFLSSATWLSLPKKHYNGLINQSINQSSFRNIYKF